MAGSMTGMTEEEYRDMMINGGRSIEGNRTVGEKPQEQVMARITASVYTSHVPAIGAAIDHGKTGEPYWQPVFKGYEFSKQWMKENRPDVIFLVYNDHATAFSLELIPTFAIGCAAEFAPADEGYGARPVPTVIGHPELASHIAQSVIQDDFDLTIVNRMDVDHGLTVPLSLMCGQPAGLAVPGDPVRRQRRAVPAAVGAALLHARPGDPPRRRVLRRAPERADLGHRRHEPPAAGAARRAHQPEFDNAFLDRLIADPEGLSKMPHIEYVREAGSEGIELVMWLIARGAMSDVIRRRGGRREAHRAAPLLPRAGVEHRGGPPDPGEQRMSATIKVALAGAGAFGIKHLDAIELIDGVEVVSLVGRELEKTRGGRGEVRHRPRHDRPRRQPGAARTSTR